MSKTLIVVAILASSLFLHACVREGGVPPSINVTAPNAASTITREPATGSELAMELPSGGVLDRRADAWSTEVNEAMERLKHALTGGKPSANWSDERVREWLRTAGKMARLVRQRVEDIIAYADFHERTAR